MKIYYAHCQAIYGTPQEKRDIEMLKALGFEVMNPNTPDVIAVAERLKLFGQEDRVMDFFVSLMSECDAVAFRALPDGDIPAGVAKEIARMKEFGKPVIELPSCILRRVLTVGQTREYLKEVGQR